MYRSFFAIALTLAGAALPASAQMSSNGNVELPFGAFVPGVDVTNKDQVAMLYIHSYYWPGQFGTSGPTQGQYVPFGAVFPIPTNWTGNTATCSAGRIGVAYRQAAVRELNFFRVLAGLSSARVASEAVHDKVQAAALIIGARGGVLDHHPPTNAPCYSAAGAEGSLSSNLSFTFSAPSVPHFLGVYFADGGADNWAVAHRRWLLYPPQQSFAYGSTEFVHPLAPNATSGADGVWIFNDNATTFENPSFVAWPYAGWVPHTLLPSSSNRWSISCARCDFSAATVSMTKDGAAMAAPAIDPLEGNGSQPAYGDATLVWEPVGVDYSLVPLTKDTVYGVTVSNVMVPGNPVPQTFSYQVKVFDVQSYGSSHNLPKYNVSDLWSVAGEPGWNVSLQLSNDGKLMATWQTFDAAGNPLWAAMPAGRWTSPTTVAGTIYTTRGSPFTATFNAADAQYTNEGVATFSFADSDHVTMQATLRGFAQNKALTRFVTNAGDTNVTDGSNYNGMWQVDGQSDWAVAINHRYQTVAATLLLHDGNGNPTWYRVAPCIIASNANTCTASVTAPQATGSPLNGTLAGVTSPNVGTATFTFTTDYSATLAFTINGANITKTLSRNVFGNLLARKLSPAAIGGIDIDGDGKSEILVQSAAPAMQAGRLVNGQLQFSALPHPGANFRLLAVGDFDGDGKSDLAYQNIVADPVYGDVHIWPGFQSSADIFYRRVKYPWLVQAVGDLDGDGSGDMVFRWTGDDGNPNDTGVSYVWFTNGVSVNQVRKRGGAPLSWTLLGAADLNGDGMADMLYISPANQVRALMATPGRTCANLAAGNVPAGYTAIKLADFTGNGRGDILAVNSTTGGVQVLSLNGNGLTLPPYGGVADDPNASCTSSSLTVANTAFAMPAIGAGWQFYAAGDLNGDGITDIVWQQPNGTLTVWLMNANGSAPTVIASAGQAPAGFSVFQP